MASKDTYAASTTTTTNISTGAYDTTPTLNTTNMSSSPTRLYPNVGGVATNGEETAVLTEQQNEETRHELAKTEEEIDTLRRVLQSKIKHANDLKRRLGISAWDELTKDVQTGLSTLTDSETMKAATETIEKMKASPFYQKAANSLGHVKDKGAELISGITTGVSKRMGDLKNTNAFKSFEASAGGIVSTVKAKVGSGTTPGAEYPPSEFPIGENSPYTTTTNTTSTTSPSKQQAYGATFSATTPGVVKTTTTTTTTKILQGGVSNA